MKNSVLCYLEQTAERLPDKVAIFDAEREISFGELRKRGIDLACAIKEQVTGRGNPILTFLPKSVENVMAFIGILYSGNFYTPTDIRFPEEKVRSVVDALEPMAIIVNTKTKEIFEKYDWHMRFVLINIDDIEACQCYEKSTNLVDEIIDADVAYTLFTSGSTGVPKGVSITNRSIIDYIDWAKECFSVTEDRILGNQAPFYFDNSTLDIYLMMATGATLAIIPESYFAFPARLMQYVEEKSINMIFWVPSVLISVANADILSRVDCACLTQVLFAGEVMPNKHLNYWRKYLPNARFANLYGPTEITVDCTYYIVEREFADEEPLPIGSPCRNSDVLVLDGDELVTEPGHIGELCVRGSSLAVGYWNDFNKTAQAFCQNPLNKHYPERIYRTGDLVCYNEYGEIMFNGRKDFQIKHMGYRIELGEIESAALGKKEVCDACATYHQECKQIVLFYRGDINEGDLRKYLLSILPKYMVPTIYHAMEEFPYTDNGKIDRKRLEREYQ